MSNRPFGAWHLGGGSPTSPTFAGRRLSQRHVDLRLNTRSNASPLLRVASPATRPPVTHLAADIVVANADAGTVYGRLIDDPAANGRCGLTSATPSSADSCCCCPVQGERRVAHHNVWFPADYDAEFDAVFGTRAEPAHPAWGPNRLRVQPRRSAHASRCRSRVVVRAGERSSSRQTTGGDRLAGTRAGRRLCGSGPGSAGRTWLRCPDRICWREVRPRGPAGLGGRARWGHHGTSSNGVRACLLRPLECPRRCPGSTWSVARAHPGGGLPLVGDVG